MLARGRDGARSDWCERCCDRHRLRGLAALSYGVVGRWPPAVAHSGEWPPLTCSLRFSRAREKRGTCRTGRRNTFCRILFVEFFFAITVGGDAGPREGWSSERLVRTLLRSAPVERTGRAELRGRWSMAAGCCAQRRVAAVNLLSAIFPRAREARHLPHRPPQHFLSNSFC